MSIEHVCPHHARDAYIVRHLQERVDEHARFRGQACSVCGEVGAVPFDELVDLLDAGIRRHYVTAEDAGVPWDKEDGRWALPTTDTHDVVWDLDPGLDDDVAAAALHHLYGRGTCSDWVPPHDPEPTPRERLWRGWSEFTRDIRHHSRFLLAPEPPHDPHDVERPYGRQEALVAIAELIESSGLVRVLPTGTTLFRARTFEDEQDDRPRQPHEIAAPPGSLASQGRMNPAGIAFLYGAFDAGTAAAEVYDGRPHVAVAELRSLAPRRVVDLTRIEDLSAFDPDVSYERYAGTAFLRDFRHDIARHIVRDDRVHYKYVPTQFLTEYLRWRLPSGPLDGVVYPSSRTGGDNVVLFVGQDGCLADEQLRVGTTRAEAQVLEIAGPTIEVRRYGPPPTTSQGTRPLGDAGRQLVPPALPPPLPS